jgi:hypothetical protein
MFENSDTGIREYDVEDILKQFLAPNFLDWIVHRIFRIELYEMVVAFRNILRVWYGLAASEFMVQASAENVETRQVSTPEPVHSPV